MSHSYPLAKNAKSALAPNLVGARTRAEAEMMADGTKVDSLQTDWLPMSEADVAALFERTPEDGAANGFLQRYEDEKGAPILAVTYWKLVAAPKASAKTKTKKPPALKPEKRPENTPGDHTDDLYFRRGRTKPRRKALDPNQMDLFGEPKTED